MPKKTPNSRRRNEIDDHPISPAAHYLEEATVNLFAAAHYEADAFTSRELALLTQIRHRIKILHARQQKRNA